MSLVGVVGADRTLRQQGADVNVWPRRSARVALVNYQARYLPPALQARVMAWLSKRVDLFVGGPDPRARNPAVHWMQYVNFSFVYSSEFYRVRDWARQHGYHYEDMYLHSDVDYRCSRPWSNMDQFDAFDGHSENEPTSPSRISFGVVGTLGHDYEDASVSAYRQGRIRHADYVYVGYGEPFDQVNVSIDLGASAGAIWQYWNGEKWHPLSLRHDGTSGFVVSGQVLFTPPMDWVPSRFWGGQSKFWLRVDFTPANRKPTIRGLSGDDWRSVKTGLNSRGWAGQSTSRVKCCGGEYEYDPTPPIDATARFRYQARLTNFGSATNSACLNHGFVERGVRPVVAYLADRAVDLVSKTNSNGVMFDDAPSITEQIQAPLDWKTHVGWSDVSSALVNKEEAYVETVKDIKRRLPTVMIGNNCAGCRSKVFARGGDWVLIEGYSTNAPGEKTFESDKSPFVTFDDFLPEHNPKNVIGVFMIADGAAAGLWNSYGEEGWVVLDRSDRRPISALAFYYIGANQNTYISYHATGVSAGYRDTDEVYYYREQRTELLEGIVSSRSHSSKRLRCQVPIGFPSSGELYIGDRAEHLRFVRRDAMSLETSDPIYNNYAAGTPIRLVQSRHQSDGPVNGLEVYRWSDWFPALGIDIGRPDPTGLNRGERMVEPRPWKTRGECGDTQPGASGIWRRDYSGAIVLLRPAIYRTTKRQYEQRSPEFDLEGSFYPLRANGTTGAAIRRVSLRNGEGAILMRTPVVADKAVD